MATKSHSADAALETEAALAAEPAGTTGTLWADESGIGILGIILIVVILLILFGFIGFSFRG